MRVFENRMLRRIRYLDLRGRKWQVAGENYVIRSCIVIRFTNVITVIKSEVHFGRDMWQASGEVHSNFWSGKLKG